MILVVATEEEMEELGPLLEQTGLESMRWYGPMGAAFDALLTEHFHGSILTYDGLMAEGLDGIETAVTLLNQAASPVVVILGHDQVQERGVLSALTGWDRYWLPPWSMESLHELLGMANETRPTSEQIWGSVSSSGSMPPMEPEASSPGVAVDVFATTPSDVGVLAAEIEQARAFLREPYRCAQSADPYAVLSLHPGCGVEAIEDAFARLARDTHPDHYRVLGDPRLLEQADYIIMRARDARRKAKEMEERRGASVARGPTGGVRIPRVSGVSPTARETSDAGGASSQPTSRVSVATPGRSQAAAERLAQLAKERARPAAQGVQVVAGAGAATQKFMQLQGSFVTNAKGERRPVSVEQLVRNARAAIDQGAHEKAWSMLTAGAAVSTRVDAKAYLAFASYLASKYSAEEALTALDVVRENAANRDQSLVRMLKGHILRMERQDDRAKTEYTEAVRADPANAEAISWARHYQNQPVKKKIRSSPTSSDNKGQGLLGKLFKK